MKSYGDIFRLGPPYFKQHVFKYLDHEPGPSVIRDVPKKALIACTARCGSSYLSVELDSFGFNFNEWLNTEGHVKAIAEREEVTTTRHLADTLASEMQCGGILGIKIPFMAIAYLTAFGEFPDHAEDWRIVFLRRNNVVRQAISRHIAFITKKWTASMPGEREVGEEDYSFDDIYRYTDGIINENANWERLFSLLKVHPMRVVYEDILEDEEYYLPKIARFVGSETGQRVENPRARTLKVQGTSLNDLWEERFYDDLRSLYGDPVTYIEELRAAA